MLKGTFRHFYALTNFPHGLKLKPLNDRRSLISMSNFLFNVEKYLLNQKVHEERGMCWKMFQCCMVRFCRPLVANCSIVIKIPVPSWMSRWNKYCRMINQQIYVYQVFCSMTCPQFYNWLQVTSLKTAMLTGAYVGLTIFIFMLENKKEKLCHACMLVRYAWLSNMVSLILGIFYLCLFSQTRQKEGSIVYEMSKLESQYRL